MRWTAAVTSFAAGLLAAGLLAVGLLAVGLVAPASAPAAGGPVGPVLGGSGIGVPGSPVRFVARQAGRGTIVQRVTDRPREVQASIRVAGRVGVPGADFSGGTTGLSADGRTLVLEQFFPAWPPRSTRLVVLDTSPLRVRKTLVLHGWSTVDAISPDGRWLYLIHYESADISKYEVLAYDLVRGRQLAKPIVDPRDRGEAMTGAPMSRVMGPGGRWAYTLYYRPSGVPFVHALDTVGLRAVCIDLPSAASDNPGTGQLRLGPGAATLQVRIGGALKAVINTRTFAVDSGRRALATRASTRSQSRGDRPGGGGPPWELIVLALAALATLGLGAKRLPRPRAT